MAYKVKINKKAIQDFPLIGSIQNKERGYTGLVIHRYTTIIYKSVNQQVTILRFYDN